ncbi:MAG: hypothetical protein ACYDCQ_22905, partial [Dehalococcoidia bacterium]
EITDAGLRIGEMLIETGALVTVDGGVGALYLGNRRIADATEPAEVRTLRRWAADLGMEPGAGISAPSVKPDRAELTLLELARTVQLKGLCTAKRAAAVLGAESEAAETLIAANEQLFRSTPRGMALTPDGRAWVMDQLTAERASVAEGALDSCYARFLRLNERFKRLVSEWQLAPADGHTEAALMALAETLSALHAEFRPLVEESAGQLARLGRYATRFDAALAQLRGGDASMLASPLKDSYHTVWFEYHEELLGLCGLDRAEEERATGGGS